MENELVQAALSSMTRHMAVNKLCNFFLLKLLVKSQLTETNIDSSNLKVYSIK